MTNILLKINTVALEGPDLSGKTTLYNQLHRLSGFRWDIRDRSFLSRVCFARQFDRDVSYERSRLEKEISNLNNRIIVLLPPLSCLEKRYEDRGDEIQTIESLRSLYFIYEEEVSRIQDLPNVLVIRDQSGSLAEKSFSFLASSEKESALDVGLLASKLVEGHSKNELTLACELRGSLATPEDHSILSDPLEGEYFKNIFWDFENVIRKELRGLNEYAKPQGMNSRRFYYSSNTCISSIHLMPRAENLFCHAVFRSTNSKVNAGIDIEFLDFLVNFLGKKYFFDCKTYSIDLKLNSAHIIDEQGRP